MLIECSRCQARYALNESILSGFTGARVRCRRCGGSIVVRAPGATPEPAAPDAGKTAAGERPAPPPLREARSIAPEIPKPPPAVARLSGPPEDAKPSLGTAPALKIRDPEPVPDNVYPLDLWRDARPKRLPTGGFDISGSVRPEPLPVPAKPKPAAVPSRPPAPPVGAGMPVSPPREGMPGRPVGDGAPVPPPRARMLERKPPYPGILEKSVRWEEEGIASPPPMPAPPPGDANPPESAAPRKSRIPEGFSLPSYTRTSHIIGVYLVLLLLGGFGYFLIRLLSRAAEKGGG